VEWSEWSECANDVRSRQQVVVQDTVGAGQECPSLKTQEEPCVDCQVAWGEWGECSSRSRSRSEIIIVPSEGAGNACPKLRTETEGKLVS